MMSQRSALLAAGLSTLTCLLAMLPGSAQSSPTIRWLYSGVIQTGGGQQTITGYFQYLGNGRWYERNNVLQAYFRELDRTGYSVLIHDDSRQLSVLLDSTTMRWRTPQTAQGQWNLLYYGGWSIQGGTPAPAPQPVPTPRPEPPANQLHPLLAPLLPHRWEVAGQMVTFTRLSSNELAYTQRNSNGTAEWEGIVSVGYDAQRGQTRLTIRYRLVGGQYVAPSSGDLVDGGQRIAWDKTYHWSRR